MPYVPPYDRIKDRVRIAARDGTLWVNVEYKEFLDIIHDLLRGVAVDQEWYMKQYPDVIESGMTAHEHFALHGYFEGRLPSELTINEEWYLANNVDVAQQIADGDMPDALTHYQKHGYAEGRLPRAF
jgi:hypothetical protein